MLYPFYSRLHRLINSNSSLRLIGSWATNEAHLPYSPDGLIESLSDIDLVNYKPITSSERKNIKEKIIRSANKSNLSLDSISIRCYEEMKELPHINKTRIRDQKFSSQEQKSKFLVFWTAVSCIENCIRIRKYNHYDQSALHWYSVTKFIFTLIRNIGFLTGLRFRSYLSLCNWISNKWKTIPHKKIYKIKTGFTSKLALDALEKIIGNSVVENILKDYQFCGAINTICRFAEQHFDLMKGKNQLQPDTFFSIGRKVAWGKPLNEVLAYEMSKLRKIR